MTKRLESAHQAPNGTLDENVASHSAMPASSDSEIKKLDEMELKAAIKSAWKKHERLAKKDMEPLLYWLRAKLGEQNGRTEIHDTVGGFGAWVEDHLYISRRNADQWSDEYGDSRKT
jgi:hypothetical protein